MAGAVPMAGAGDGRLRLIASIISIVASGVAFAILALAAGTLFAGRTSIGTTATLLWPTYGPGIAMLSLACLACTLVLRPLAGLGPVASLAAGAATALSFLIVTMIQLAIIGAGGALAPQLGLSLAPIGSGAPDLRETFVTPDGARLTHSIYKPAGGYRIPTPMLLYVHGGGWIGGDPDGSAHDLRWFADHGWLVISLDYRLASPTHPTWNSATSDVVCGLDWAAANAERLGGDVSHIAVVGDSAGGTLALTASYAIAAGSRVSVCTGPHPKVGAVVAGSPVIDLKHSYEHGLPQPGREPTNFIVRYLGGPPAQHPDRVAAVSPAHYLAKGAPPTLLIVPAQDTFIPPEGSDGFVAAARAAEVPVERVDIPFAGHTFYHRAAGSVGNYGYLTIIRSYLTKRGLAPR